jgi:hypothetical protein
MRKSLKFTQGRKQFVAKKVTAEEAKGTLSSFNCKCSSVKPTGPTLCNRNRLCRREVARRMQIEMPIELDILA